MQGKHPTKTISAVVIGIIILALISITYASPQSESMISRGGNGAVGDVKMSLLLPEPFRQLNGDGWVLMDGQNDSQKLKDWTGLSKVPDARGVFLRGMNLGRPTDKGDTAGDRLVGAYQADSFKKHSHTLNGGYDGKNSNTHLCLKHSHKDAKGHPGPTNQSGGAETRPRNIAVYIYVKVK